MNKKHLKERITARLILLIILLSVFFLWDGWASAQTQRVFIFDTPIGKNNPAAAQPYDQYEIHFTAQPGDRLSFATKLVQSNDYFFAPAEWGIALFDTNGVAQGGVVTNQVFLWDAGTEQNEKIGAGGSQAANKGGAADGNRLVRRAGGAGIPSANGSLFVWIDVLGSNEFVFNILNLSGSYSLSPGVMVLHRDNAPIFQSGQPDRGQGLEALAEDGNPYPLLSALNAKQSGSGPPAEQPPSMGGNPPSAHSSDRVMVFDTPIGTSVVGPAGPRQRFELNFTANPGDHLSFATMLMESNDYFFSFNEWGIALFDENGQPRSRVVTDFVGMWDAGTEANEVPTEGDNQPARQPAPNSGKADENSAVRRAHDNFQRIDGVEKIIRVWIRSTGGNSFNVWIENMSGGKTLSPGVAVLHRDYAPLFETGLPDRGVGFEALAEDGNPYPLAAALRQR